MKNIKTFFSKYKHAWLLCYGFIYLPWFCYLEKTVTRHYHVMHVALDDFIPFNEYFIIPYLLWFFYIAATVIYFSFINKDKKEYWQLICTLGIGMTLFILISLIYPNGQNLRPQLSGDSIFIRLVQSLYLVDTPTNILPSIHVFNSVACCIAIFRHKAFKQHKLFLGGVWLLTVLIVLATVFLKQHTLVDVIAAVALNIVCFQLLYNPKAVHAEKPARV